MSSKVMGINFGGQPRTEKGNINRVIANIIDYMKQPKNDRFNKKKNRYTQRQMLGHLDANDFAHTLSRYELYHVSIWHLIPPY